MAVPRLASSRRAHSAAHVDLHRRRVCALVTLKPLGLSPGMTSNTDDLEKALQENLKLRRELATEVAEVKGEKLAAVRYRLARVLARCATPSLDGLGERPYQPLSWS